jgi:hypothetical protein
MMAGAKDEDVARIRDLVGVPSLPQLLARQNMVALKAGLAVRVEGRHRAGHLRPHIREVFGHGDQPRAL